jgi:diaminohydroxyphosphoribosylaminopyrimidine deaminase/5-amino-6-(5-phosphoribosylamino)uracil reductase
VDLDGLLAALAARDVMELMVEGGARVQASLWAAGLVDRLVWYLAPLVLGGDAAPGLVAGAGAPTLAAGRRLRLGPVTTAGPDLRVLAYPEPVTHERIQMKGV